MSKPAQDYLTINLERYRQLSYRILDMSGKPVRASKPQFTQNHYLDVRQLVSDVYVIHAIVDGQSTQLRFVKQ